MSAEPVSEMYWEDGSLPRDSLSRAAGRLKGRGSLYLGAGIGVEVKKNGDFNVIGGGTHDGPLSAVTQALSLAGRKRAEGTPGGKTAITDPAVAARVFELDSEEAEVKATIRRMERTLARRQKQPVMPSDRWSPGLTDDLTWEQRRILESRERLKQIAAERRDLLEGKVTEGLLAASGRTLQEAEVGKPGTNWKQVGPEAKSRLSGLMKHYRKKAKPFTACVTDNTKRFGKDGAERVCAVLKDLIKRSTKWRKGGKVTESQVWEEEALLHQLLEASAWDAEGLERYLLASIIEAEAPVTPEEATRRRSGHRGRRPYPRPAGVVLGRSSAGATGDVDAPDAGVGA